MSIEINNIIFENPYFRHNISEEMKKSMEKNVKGWHPSKFFSTTTTAYILYFVSWNKFIIKTLLEYILDNFINLFGIFNITSSLAFHKLFWFLHISQWRFAVLLSCFMMFTKNNFLWFPPYLQYWIGTLIDMWPSLKYYLTYNSNIEF